MHTVRQGHVVLLHTLASDTDSTDCNDTNDSLLDTSMRGFSITATVPLPVELSVCGAVNDISTPFSLQMLLATTDVLATTSSSLQS